MIIGNGLIASAFKESNVDFSDYMIFASGVSNSMEFDENEYNREKKLIIETLNSNKKLKFIYFSSILVGYIDNKYYNNKIKNEELIKNNSNNYIIFRVPQIVGELGNSRNIINHFKNCINNKEEITIYENTQRSLIDVEDLVDIVNYCKDKTEREILNFSYIEKIEVLDLCHLIANILNQKPIIKCIKNKLSNNWDIENSKLIEKALMNIKLLNYNLNVLQKYLKK